MNVVAIGWMVGGVEWKMRRMKKKKTSEKLVVVDGRWWRWQQHDKTIFDYFLVGQESVRLWGWMVAMALYTCDRIMYGESKRTHAHRYTGRSKSSSPYHCLSFRKIDEPVNVARIKARSDSVRK